MSDQSSQTHELDGPGAPGELEDLDAFRLRVRAWANESLVRVEAPAKTVFQGKFSYRHHRRDRETCEGVT